MALRATSQLKPAEPEPSREPEQGSVDARALAAVAHELKNPIQILGNLLFLIGREATSETAKNYLIHAQQELAALRSIVANLMGALREQPPEEDVSPTQVLEKSLQTFAEKIAFKRVAIDARLDLPDIIRTSPIEIRMIFENVLRNALEAVPMDGSILVHLGKSRDWKDLSRTGLRLVVLDNGPGIPREHWGKIFEPFFTTKTEKGTGIGLWIVQRVIRKHVGSIRFRTRVQSDRSGTVFSVFLPIAEQSEAASSPLTMSANSDSAA